MATLGRRGTIWSVAMLLLAWTASARADDLEAATAARMGNFPAAVARWTAFAQQGDPDAAYHLADAYDHGLGVPKDPHQADYWYRTAAAGGSAEAAYALGLKAENTERPDGTPEDLDAAIAWYRQALAEGDPRARERLAALGAGIDEPGPRSPAATTSAATEAPARLAPAERRTPEPPPGEAADHAFARAAAIWRRHGLDGTDSTVVAALTAAAKQGDAVAQYDLAYAYEHGLGVPADPAQAYAWYRHAAQSGGPDRLVKAAETNARALGAKLTDEDRQTARVDGANHPTDR